MITTTLNWSNDISAAPKGELVETVMASTRNGKPVEHRKSEHVSPKILALTKCGKIVSTYWIPEKVTASGTVLGGARWSGLATSEHLVLWAPWPDAAALAELHALGVEDEVPGEIRLGDLLKHAEVDA
jgi:hypothetical protein